MAIPWRGRASQPYHGVAVEVDTVVPAGHAEVLAVGRVLDRKRLLCATTATGVTAAATGVTTGATGAIGVATDAIVLLCAA